VLVLPYLELIHRAKLLLYHSPTICPHIFVWR
jgi:hypothetical protein